ncbi:MAG: methyltransferase domain-containing protein [Chloroflexi bacterium]|nr:methyltransferase domain-containing protein [Chloroflexota bacterium]
MLGLILNPLRALAHRLENKVGKRVIRREVHAFANHRRTLDLGCGRSPNADAFPNRVGVDIVPGGGVHVIADAHHLPWASGAFSQIVVSEVLEHLADPPQAAREMNRVLEIGGQLILTTPFVYPVHEAPFDFQRFTAYGLSRLFALAGFDVDQIKPLFTEEQTLAILIQRVAFQRADPAPLHYLYLLVAHLLYRLSLGGSSPRYQDVNRRAAGPFLTAGYLLLAHKPRPSKKDS